MQVKISLLIANGLFRRGFFTLLAGMGYTVLSSYEKSKEMLANLSTQGLPNVILLDADSEETATVENVLWLREHHPSVKILALTLNAEKAVIKPLLDNGAHGYLWKAAAPGQIKTAIKSVVEKGVYLPPSEPWQFIRC